MIEIEVGFDSIIGLHLRSGMNFRLEQKSKKASRRLVVYLKVKAERIGVKSFRK